MQCAYCSRECTSTNKGSLGKKSIFKLLDFFEKQDSHGMKAVQLTGGEPFLYKHIHDVVKYILEKGFICRIQTNGTLVSRAITDRPDLYSSPRVVFKISLDGWSEETNALSRGRGTFKPAVEGLKTALTINKLVGLKTVVHEGNIGHLGKMLDFCLESKVAGWSYNPLMPVGRNRNTQCSIGELAIAKKLINLFRYKKYRHLMNGTNILAYLWLMTQNRRSFPPYYYVNFDGRIYLTDNLTPERRLGSIYGERLGEDFDLRQLASIPDLAIEKEVLLYVSSQINLRIIK